MKTVVIANGVAHRYEGRTHVDKALIPDDATARETRELIEDFRVNGLPEVVEPAPVPPRDHEVIVREVFERIVHEAPHIPLVRDYESASA